MSVISSEVTIDSILEYFPTLESINDADKVKFIKEAYWYCVNKMRLRPVVVSLWFDGEGYCNLLNQVFTDGTKEVMFKEVIAVHCDNYSDEKIGLIELIPSLSELKTPTGTAYQDGEVLYATGLVNIVGYAYPWLTNNGTYSLDEWSSIGAYKCSPCLLYPVVAMMYSLFCKESNLFNRAGMYESLAIKYITLYNDNLLEPKVSNLTETIKVGAYEL